MNCKLRKQLALLLAVVVLVACTGCADPAPTEPTLSAELIPQDSAELLAMIPEEIQRQVKEDYFAQFMAEDDAGDANRLDHTRLRVYGVFGDTYVLFVDVPGIAYTAAISKGALNGYVFTLPSSQQMYIYQAGHFYTLFEAGFHKMLTDEEALVAYTNYTGRHSAGKPMNPEPMEAVIVSKKAGENAAEEACMTLFFDGSQYRLERYIPGNRFVRTYDLEGKLLLNQRFLGEKLQSQTAYTYDTEGKLIKTEGFGYDEVYTTYLTEYFYDASGNLTRRCQYTNEELRYEYHYDGTGRLVEGYSYIAGVNHTVYTYDAAGRLLCSETESDGELSGGWQYTYDETGRLIREDQFRISNGKRIELTNSYVYDEQGRCVRYNLGGFQGEQSYEEYTYDDAGNMLSSTYHHYTGDVSTYCWTYDQQGRMLSMRNEDYWYVGCSWSYDQQGNVTAMTNQGEKIIFHYTWPEDLPAWLQNEIAVQITGLTKLEVYTPEVYTRLWNFEKRNS